MIMVVVIEVMVVVLIVVILLLVSMLVVAFVIMVIGCCCIVLDPQQKNFCLLACLDAQMTTVIPLVCKYCHQAFSKQDETLTAVAKHFGKLCRGLSGLCFSSAVQSRPGGQRDGCSPWTTHC